MIAQIYYISLFIEDYQHKLDYSVRVYNALLLVLLFIVGMASETFAQLAVYPIHSSLPYAKAKTGGSYMHNYYLLQVTIFH